MKTYTPGFFRTKAVCFVLSLAICAIGAADLWLPLRLLIAGKHVNGVIIRVEKTKPGFPNEVYTTTQPISEDVNRSATFWHYAEFLTEKDQIVRVKLNAATQLRPAYSIGDRVSLAYDKRNPQIALAIADLRTWTVGSYVFGVGIIFAIASFLFAYFARKPITLSEDASGESAAVAAAGDPVAKSV